MTESTAEECEMLRASEAYEADIAPNNRPGRLEDYMDWFNKIGMKAQVLHLHGNIALIGASEDVLKRQLV